MVIFQKAALRAATVASDEDTGSHGDTETHGVFNNEDHEDHEGGEAVRSAAEGGLPPAQRAWG